MQALEGWRLFVVNNQWNIAVGAHFFRVADIEQTVHIRFLAQHPQQVYIVFFNKVVDAVQYIQIFNQLETDLVSGHFIAVLRNKVADNGALGIQVAVVDVKATQFLPRSNQRETTVYR